MRLKALWRIIEKEVFTFPSTDVLFNQYGQSIEGLDLPGGELIRRENLKNYIGRFIRRPAVLVVGEAAGPWGCRFSGVPFTGERQLEAGGLPFKGRKSSVHEPPYLERSGSILWEKLLPHFPDFILWNAVPFHPHRRGEPLSIRKPSMGEVMAAAGTLKKIISALRPSRTIAVGRTAEAALRTIGVEAIYVRHPANGGARAFREGMGRVFLS